MRPTSQKAKINDSELKHTPKSPNQSRRSIAKAGIVAPVIMSLANRPAWGANVRCIASGFGSLVEIGSGVDIADITCDYSDSSIIKNNNLIKKAKQKKLSDLFGCTGPNQDTTVGEVLSGSDDWLINMVIAYYNANPETTTTFINKNGKEVTKRDLKVVIQKNNPFGDGCPVEDVYCHFESGNNKPIRLGDHTEMTKLEIIYFLSIVLYQ